MYLFQCALLWQPTFVCVTYSVFCAVYI